MRSAFRPGHYKTLSVAMRVNRTGRKIEHMPQLVHETFAGSTYILPPTPIVSPRDIDGFPVLASSLSILSFRDNPI